MRKQLSLVLILIFTILPLSGVLSINFLQNVEVLNDSKIQSAVEFGNAIDISSISIADDYTPSIALDSHGNVHVAFCDSNDILYYTSSVNNFATLAVVASGGGIPYESPRILIDSNDVIHIFYEIQVAPERTLWYVNNSIGLFTNHINLTARTGVKCLYGNFDVEKGSNDIFHVVSMSNDEVYYFNLKAGTCSSAVLLSTPDADSDGAPQIAVGQYIMAAWYWSGGVKGTEIMCSTKISGLPWSREINISKTPGLSKIEMNPGVAIDKIGNFHLFYDNWTGTPHISYCTNKGGVLNYQNLNFPWKSNTRNEIKTDSNSAIHALYFHDKTGNNEIYYLTNVNGPFQYYNLSCNSNNDMSPNLIIDSYNNIHLVYSSNRGGNYDIYYQKITYNEPPNGEIPGWDWIFLVPTLFFLVFLGKLPRRRF